MTEEIGESDSLYRRFFSNELVPDVGGKRLASSVYKKRPHEDGVSMNLARISTPQETQRGGEVGMGVGELPARVPLGTGFTLKHDPKPDNQAHVLMTGEFKRANRKILARATRVVIEPE